MLAHLLTLCLTSLTSNDYSLPFLSPSTNKCHSLSVVTFFTHFPFSVCLLLLCQYCFILHSFVSYPCPILSESMLLQERGHNIYVWYNYYYFCGRVEVFIIVFWYFPSVLQPPCNIQFGLERTFQFHFCRLLLNPS